jgi:hypothetical protein
MKQALKMSGSLLALATIAGGLTVTPAAAQDAASLQRQIQQMQTQFQQQMQQLREQLKQVQDAAARDRATAEQTRHSQEMRKASDAQAATAAAQAQAAAAAAQAAAGRVAAAPPPPPLPQGAFKVGDVTVTLGGFAAAEGVYRSRNEAASIDTNFNGNIPLPNTANYHTPEYRETAQQSRFSLLATARPDTADTLTSYLETDFLSAGTSSNANQSSSYTLRLRQFFGAWDNTDLGLHVEGGQGWSLATMNRVGMLPRQENVPLTIDAQYTVGFDWARQAEVRVVKDVNRTFWAGLALEAPQTIFGGAAGPNCLTGAGAATGIGGGTLEYTQCGGPNVNTIQAYSDNIAPDIIAKLAADPGFGHYEVYGLLRFLGGRVSEAGSGRTYQTTGEGLGAGMILPVLPKLLDFQVSGLFGQGVGRYGSAQLADVTFSPSGKIEPLAEYSVMGGFVGHPIPAVDVYAYGGAEGAARKYYSSGAVNTGYGNPNVGLAGCEVELGSCSASTSGVVEGTLGAWWRVLKSSYGTMQVGAQYEYIDRTTFQGVGATKGSVLAPSTNENAFLVSLRYYPFQ